MRHYVQRAKKVAQLAHDELAFCSARLLTVAGPLSTASAKKNREAAGPFSYARAPRRARLDALTSQRIYRRLGLRQLIRVRKAIALATPVQTGYAGKLSLNYARLRALRG